MASDRPVLRFETSAVADWPHIEEVTAAVSWFLDDHRIEPARSILIVSTELLENALKYGRASAEIRYDLEVGSTTRIAVTSGFDQASGDLLRLLAEIASLRRLPDPRRAFVGRLQRIYDGEPQEGGLGLARIASEGPCHLSCRVDDERGEVEVIARLAGAGR